MTPSTTPSFSGGSPEAAWFSMIASSSPAMSLPPPESRIARGCPPRPATFSNSRASVCVWLSSYAMPSTVSPLCATDSISNPNASSSRSSVSKNG